MNDIVLNTSVLPEPLMQMVRTDKVKVREMDGVITMTPIYENKIDCPLRGLATDSDLTVDRFLAMTHDETELKQ